MRSLQLLVTSLFACIGLYALAQDDPVLLGTVMRVTDGDTITVKLDSGPITVRFDSIDAPERNQPWGVEASQALAELLDRQEISLQVVEQDRYERLVAVVYLGDLDVNAWMVEHGHAWAYRQYLSRSDYCNWEHEARTEALGLWALPPDKRRAPWDWRQYERNNIEHLVDYSNESVARCIAAIGRGSDIRSTRPQPSSPNRNSCNIKGNISESGRIYHVPGSRNYDATRIDESSGERWFCTEEEARAAGWRSPKA